MIVHEIEPGIFVPYPSGQKLYRTSAVETVIVRREDGSESQSDRECEPYPVEIRPAEIVFSWSKERRESAGLFEPQPFVAPEGKQTVGAPRYQRVKGVVREIYDVEDIPPPPPEPSREEKAIALARQFGLTIEDLRSVLAGTDEAKDLR